MQKEGRTQERGRRHRRGRTYRNKNLQPGSWALGTRCWLFPTGLLATDLLAEALSPGGVFPGSPSGRACVLGFSNRRLLVLVFSNFLPPEQSVAFFQHLSQSVVFFQQFCSRAKVLLFSNSSAPEPKCCFFPTLFLSVCFSQHSPSSRGHIIRKGLLLVFPNSWLYVLVFTTSFRFPTECLFFPTVAPPVLLFSNTLSIPPECLFLPTLCSSVSVFSNTLP